MSLNVPVQLAIPVDNVPAGYDLYFLRAGSIPDATGAEVPIWFQVDSGSFAGGLARTASPPFPGVGTSGTYVVVQSPRHRDRLGGR